MFNSIIHYCRYPEYQFISDNKISQSAGTGTRYSFNSLYGVIFDIEMLAESDYIVCTFSSQVSHATQYAYNNKEHFVGMSTSI